MLKRILVGLLIVVLAVVAFGVYRTITPPADLYTGTGAFPGCPSRPSCVSSASTNATHAIAPLSATGQLALVPVNLERALQGMPGLVQLVRRGNYLHAVFATPKMGYRDDLELLVEGDGRIQVRSISRFGYRDFGVNRARVEVLRKAYRETADDS